MLPGALNHPCDVVRAAVGSSTPDRLLLCGRVGHRKDAPLVAGPCRGTAALRPRATERRAGVSSTPPGSCAPTSAAAAAPGGKRPRSCRSRRCCARVHPALSCLLALPVACMIPGDCDPTLSLYLVQMPGDMPCMQCESLMGEGLIVIAALRRLGLDARRANQRLQSCSAACRRAPAAAPLPAPRRRRHVSVVFLPAQRI